MCYSASFGSAYTKIGTIQRRLAWPLRKDDMQICEVLHIFLNIVKLQDIKLTHRNPLHSYTLTMKKQKEKLRKQYHSSLQQKELTT